LTHEGSGMSEPIESRIFIKKYSEFSAPERNDINKAIQRILVDPGNNQFKRDYLTPYRQEHPTDKQLTIFFEHLPDKERVYFVWINDFSCPHDTHKNHGEDPCLVQFKKLQTTGALEQYNPDVHEGSLKITPRESNPHFFEFNAIHIKAHGNILKDDGSTYYCMGMVFTDQQNENLDALFIHHNTLLLKILYEHFKKNNQYFEFRIPSAFQSEIINYLEQAYDDSEWEKEEDEDDSLYVLKMIAKKE
jgi:hypothetical protein